jgi:hypothetical protein
MSAMDGSNGACSFMWVCSNFCDFKIVFHSGCNLCDGKGECLKFTSNMPDVVVTAE